MADTPEEDPYAGLQSSSEEEEGVQETDAPVESLISGRAKRSTAGLHMSALLEAAADDDLTLLFEEVEDDNEFAEDEAGEEDDMALDSSSDDDDDQGPNAENDFEGEKQLQKEERKKRRAQNDLRFQTLRKRVKIDPTAVASVPPPRPKKKSERISWLPTLEDGPTRTSSRRQTMANKEVTHARLKDSQEKRIRIIATMKEAEKRKAHLKPKKMTQEDHLAEAARIERLNSKSVNRWEAAEKRRAEERKAKIEALQNRRLDGPVISYWSGVATWTNGRLTRVGKIDIKGKPEKPKSEKDDPKKKKKEEKTVESQGAPSATPAPEQAQQGPVNTPTQPESALAPIASVQPTVILQSDQNTFPSPPVPNTVATPNAAAPPAPTAIEPAKPDVQATDNQVVESTEEAGSKVPDNLTDDPAKTPSTADDTYPGPVVEIPAPTKPDAPMPDNSQSPKSTKNTHDDAMDIDQKPPEVNAETEAAQSAANQTNPPTATSADTQAVSGGSQTGPSPTEQSQQVTLHLAPAPATTPLDTQAPPIKPHDAAPLQTTPSEINGVQGHQPEPALPAPLTSHEPNGLPAQADVSNMPQLPPVIEKTGRNLTILENFDEKTAHSKKYSMYFNARKPPRLTKISSSLCVITSLPSRYRDPETALPYANSYAYGQIRKMLSQGYIWSSMLGCFVGAADTAARGVPDRFLGKTTVEKTSTKPTVEVVVSKDSAKPVPNGTAVEPTETGTTT
jgi:vacuolar protein sorting-associated protein 72